MRFIPTPISGAYLIEVEPVTDSRGAFARTFCVREFSAHGLNTEYVQCSVSLNVTKGTLRGLHFQRHPAVEAKLVRCTAGAIYDVIADVRRDSPSFGRHFGVELTARNRTALYVPERVAHGFQTLEPDCEVFYQISGYYSPDHAVGVRYDDPTLGVSWPLAITAMSDRDRALPGFEEAAASANA